MSAWNIGQERTYAQMVHGLHLITQCLRPQFITVTDHETGKTTKINLAQVVSTSLEVVTQKGQDLSALSIETVNGTKHFYGPVADQLVEAFEAST